MIWRGDEKPLIGAPIWIDGKVRERLVERPNGTTEIFLEDKERLGRRQ